MAFQADQAQRGTECMPDACAVTTVFGVDLHAEVELPFLSGALASPTGRRLKMRVADSDHVGDSGWLAGAALLCDQREADGSVAFQIEAHPDAGFRIWGPAHGVHLLSGDGRRLSSFPNGSPPEAWQRLLVAQVLPFAATLQGLEVFHAGAVVLDGRALALAGPSGAGKTSVAVELCRQGADFLADDVLALERSDGELLAHPGAPLAGIDHAEMQRLSGLDARPPHETLAVNARERLVRMPSVSSPVALGGLFFLERLPDGPPEPRFEPLSDAQPLLMATFNFVLSTPQRLLGLLEVCALVAQHRVERVLFGPTSDASQVGTAIRRRLDRG
ncbi:MAG TPA: hypothetical protein VK781_14345 [Solirubrobacteraceae bacterium]|jgi:HPr kinase/phosphorylase|nr:hypothetical protein [Solirubrobacteraceae bacterium]